MSLLASKTTELLLARGGGEFYMRMVREQDLELCLWVTFMSKQTTFKSSINMSNF